MTSSPVAAGTARASLVVATSLVFAVGIAVPGAADAQGVVCACQSKSYSKGSTLRIVEGQSKCSYKETEICWNQVGPVGPQGPAGAQGPPGEQGPPGADTVGKVVRIQLLPDEIDQPDRTWFVPAGKVLLLDQVLWNDTWMKSTEPMVVRVRHAINVSGSGAVTEISSSNGQKSFSPPLPVPANAGFEVPGITSVSFPTVNLYGRLVDADSELLTSLGF